MTISSDNITVNKLFKNNHTDKKSSTHNFIASSLNKTRLIEQTSKPEGTVDKIKEAFLQMPLKSNPPPSSFDFKEGAWGGF